MAQAEVYTLVPMATAKLLGCKSNLNVRLIGAHGQPDTESKQ